MLVDVDRGIALVPGTGDDRFTVTYSEDLAHVIARLIGYDQKWPDRLFISGSNISPSTS